MTMTDSSCTRRPHRRAAGRGRRLAARAPLRRRSTARCCTSPAPTSSTACSPTTDRSNTTLRNLQQLFDHGRLGGTGYVSILPVDQGIEHSAGASFAPNPIYFDPRGDRRARDRGRLQRGRLDARRARRGQPPLRPPHPVHRQAQPQRAADLPEPLRPGASSRASQRAWELGAVGVGATIYFGSEESTRQIVEISQAFEAAHELGMFTVLWCYLRNPAFKHDGVDYHLSADLTGQANHLGVTIEADIIKQKLPENNGGYTALGHGLRQDDELVYSELTTDHPIDLCRYQVANCYMGRAGLINSGGASSGATDLAEAVRTAVINKRAGGTGLITRPQGVPAADERGRRAPQRRPGRLPLAPRSPIALDARRRRPRRPSRAISSSKLVPRLPAEPLARAASRRRPAGSRSGGRTSAGSTSHVALGVEADAGERDARRARARCARRRWRARSRRGSGAAAISAQPRDDVDAPPTSRAPRRGRRASSSLGAPEADRRRRARDLARDERGRAPRRLVVEEDRRGDVQPVVRARRARRAGAPRAWRRRRACSAARRVLALRARRVRRRRSRASAATTTRAAGACVAHGVDQLGGRARRSPRIVSAAAAHESRHERRRGEVVDLVGCGRGDDRGAALPGSSRSASCRRHARRARAARLALALGRARTTPWTSTPSAHSSSAR